jgi:NADH-quinone oxidoreductase subunit L
LIYAAWFVWLLPIAAVPFVPLLGSFDEKIRDWFAVAVTALTALIGLYLAATFSSASSETSKVLVPLLNLPIEVQVDGLSALLSAFISFLSFLIVLYSIGYMKGEAGQSRYYSLILLFVGSMLALVMAGNLIQLYFFWEMVGICSAFLIAFWNYKPEARRAGLKAFIVTRFGDIALLIAVLFVFSTLNTTNIGSLLSAVTDGSLSKGTVQLIGVLVLFGSMGKSAQVPLHVWLPDAMEGPTPVSALIHAATMVNAGVYLLLRLSPLFDSSSTLLALVTIVGVTSMIFGAACAIVSEDLKRILAYSTISQLGLMFVAIGVGNSLGATYHLISQGLFKALAFLAAGSVITATGLRNVEEMGGLRKTMKYTYVGFLLSILAMSGLPPLTGFWSKDWIIGTALGSNTTAGVLIILSSILTALYGFRALIKVFHGPSKLAKLPKESSPTMTIPIMALSISVAVGWVLLNNQKVLSFSGALAIDPLTIGLSLAAIAGGLSIAYMAFSARIQATQNLLQMSPILQSLRKDLLEGLGFDRFYRFLYFRIVLPLSRISTYLQSGVLGINMALMFVTLLAVLFLFAFRVI